jgi:hypothetical protein
MIVAKSKILVEISVDLLDDRCESSNTLVNPVFRH